MHFTLYFYVVFIFCHCLGFFFLQNKLSCFRIMKCSVLRRKKVNDLVHVVCRLFFEYCKVNFKYLAVFLILYFRQKNAESSQKFNLV